MQYSGEKWPPVLLIRKRTIAHHRTDRLPDAKGKKTRFGVLAG